MRRKRHTLRGDFCRFLLAVAFISFVLQLLYICFNHRHSHASDDQEISLVSTHLLSIPFAWNRLHFSSGPPQESLNIALFLGGDSPDLTHRALTLHLALARRGHTVHIFSVYQLNTLFFELHHNVHFHLSKPSPFGSMNHIFSWKQFSEQNTTKPFDVVHTQGTALPHFQASGLPNVVISWDGIPFRSLALNSSLGCLAEHPWHRWIKGTEEHRFFDSYAHHVAADEIDAKVLKREYRIPQSRVHVIFDGVDQEKFTQNLDRGMDFRRWHGVPDSAVLVLGITKGSAGDDIHNLLTEAIRQMIKEDPSVTQSVFFLVAGDGPWIDWYREIGPNVLIVGPINHNLLPDFYNALDILVYPAAFGVKKLDQTAKEAMLSAKQVMIIAFESEMEPRNETLSSDMNSVLPDKLLQAKNDLLEAIKDGREVLWKKGKERRHSAMHLFTMTKMLAAYERLFLCISRSIENGKEYCHYPLSSD